MLLTSANSKRTSLSSCRSTISFLVAKTTPFGRSSTGPKASGMESTTEPSGSTIDTSPFFRTAISFSPMERISPSTAQSSGSTVLSCHRANVRDTGKNTMASLPRRAKIAGPAGASVYPVGERIFEAVFARHSRSEHAAERTPVTPAGPSKKLPATPCTCLSAPVESTIAPTAGTSIPDWPHAQPAKRMIVRMSLMAFR